MTPTSDDSTQAALITRHDLIAEVIARYPEAAEVLMDFGIGCVGCYVSEFETLEDGILGHGFSEEELEEVLSDLNEIAQQGGEDHEEGIGSEEEF